MCWDLNGNGVADPAEDINGDTVVNRLDCAGPQGVAGADGAMASLEPMEPMARMAQQVPLVPKASLEPMVRTGATGRRAARWRHRSRQVPKACKVSKV